MPDDDLRRLIEAFVARQEPRLARRFIELVRYLEAKHSTTELATLLDQGRFDLVLEGLERASQSFMVSTLQEIYLVAGKLVSDYFSRRIGDLVVYDAANGVAVRLVQEHASALVANLVNAQHDAVVQALVRGQQLGQNPRVQAVAIQRAIGLTPKQEEYVESYRRALMAGSDNALLRELRDRRFDPSVARAVEGGDNLSPAQIERMVGRYRERWIRHRAFVIAQHEGLQAVHGAQYEGIRQAIMAGDVDPLELRHRWWSRGDELVRGSHRPPLHGQIVPYGQPFISGRGNLLRYPHDPEAPRSETLGCRCVSTVVFA